MKVPFGALCSRKGGRKSDSSGGTSFSGGSALWDNPTDYTDAMVCYQGVGFVNSLTNFFHVEDLSS